MKLADSEKVSNLTRYREDLNAQRKACEKGLFFDVRFGNSKAPAKYKEAARVCVLAELASEITEVENELKFLGVKIES